MRATDLKEKFPIYPKLLRVKEGQNQVYYTLVRKKFDDKFYLCPISGRHRLKKAAKKGIISHAKAFIKVAEFIDPESDAGKEGIGYVLDDIQD